MTDQKLDVNGMLIQFGQYKNDIAKDCEYFGVRPVNPSMYQVKTSVLSFIRTLKHTGQVKKVWYSNGAIFADWDNGEIELCICTNI